MQHRDRPVVCAPAPVVTATVMTGHIHVLHVRIRRQDRRFEPDLLRRRLGSAQKEEQGGNRGELSKFHYSASVL